MNDTPCESSLLSSELAEVLSVQNSELNYRVLEADDLDQAELLARVWHPDVVLLDSTKIADSLSYLKQFSSYPDLAALPIVTLDHQTTEAANHVTGLSVYPCLASDHSSRISALLQVIQVAAGMSRKPNILVMDIGEKGSKEESSNPNPKSQILTSSTSDSSWLQALSQYLETAGFRSIISSSWAEVNRQIHAQSVDLILLRLRDSRETSVLVSGLNSLTQLSAKPPILVLDHRLDHARRDEVETGKSKSNSELESLLLSVATQIIPGHSQSMSQLLHLINHTLIQK
jgi:DNA-binding response OmpR family regulator